MIQYNITNQQNLEQNYLSGLLPQRNNKNTFYFDSSCRSNLKNFQLTSENRRIIKKTQDFQYQLLDLDSNIYTPIVQKQIKNWVKQLGWDFPISSVKYVFTQHIFNKVYIWTKDQNIIAYGIGYFDKTYSHIAYVFYDPVFSHSDLPIRLVLQVVIDSHQLGLNYCYLGRFNQETKTGYYKRNFPGFEYYQNNQWVSL